MTRPRLFAVLWLVCAACGAKGDDSSSEKRPPAPPAAPAAPEPFDIDNVASCAPCHGAIVNEYLASMHGRSDSDHDPIFKALLALRVAREGAAVADQCTTCHEPRRAMLGVDKGPGLGCATCHNAQSVDPEKRGHGALAMAGGTLLTGGRDLAPGIAPHATGPAPEHMKDGVTLCLACHGELHNAAGAPMCQTGEEYAQAPRAERPDTCMSCHMPRLRGPAGSASQNQIYHASHGFLGGHDAWYRSDASQLRKAVDVTVEWRGPRAVVTATNRTGHRFPTGFPGRMAVIEVVGFDKDNNIVWESYGKDAASETPDAVMQVVYADADGKPTLAPYAASVVRDSRLAPGETRTLSFELPAQAVLARAILWFHLANPTLAEKLDLTHRMEGEVRYVLRADARR